MIENKIPERSCSIAYIEYLEQQLQAKDNIVEQLRKTSNHAGKQAEENYDKILELEDRLQAKEEEIKDLHRKLANGLETCDKFDTKIDVLRTKLQQAKEGLELIAEQVGIYDDSEIENIARQLIKNIWG